MLELEYCVVTGGGGFWVAFYGEHTYASSCSIGACAGVLAMALAGFEVKVEVKDAG